MDLTQFITHKVIEYAFYKMVDDHSIPGCNINSPNLRSLGVSKIVRSEKTGIQVSLIISRQ
jgi:hypothetical protein